MVEPPRTRSDFKSAGRALAHECFAALVETMDGLTEDELRNDAMMDGLGAIAVRMMQISAETYRAAGIPGGHIERFCRSWHRTFTEACAARGLASLPIAGSA